MKQLNVLWAAGLLVAIILSCTDQQDSQEESADSQKAPNQEYIDPVVAASDHYTLLSEEGPVRVVEMRLPAGVRDNEHSHHHETVYFIAGGSAKIHVGEDVMDAEIPDGHVMHHEPWTHSVENTGDSMIHAIIFERTDTASVSAMEGYIDPVAAASDHYSLLSKEGNVRVVRMTLPPGEQDNEHSHYAESVYFLKGGKVNIHVGDEVMEAEIPDGHVMHHEPWTHSVSNVGETPIEAIIFERLPSSH